MAKLEFIIEDLIALAESKSPEAVKKRLNKGLNLNLKKAHGLYTLTLWREDKYPAIKEWNIVTGLWPYPVGVPTYWKGRHKNRCFLRGTIPLDPKSSVM